MQAFDLFGVMIDCSRNAVMSLPALKKFAKCLAKMGYNTLMLYTEDTFEVNHQPYFGYLRGRYSKEELKEFDAYCASLGMELIPCIQTLAHLNAIFRWRTYWDVKDCNDILLIGSDKTYALIEDMISTVSECFRSKRIHIGMDEAHMVGLGNYLKQNGACDRFELLKEHLARVVDICKKYDLNPMLWSDMFCIHGLHMKNYYNTNGIRLDENLTIPDASLVYWDYYHTDYNDYARLLDVHALFQREIIFAGGAWTWRGFVPDNAFSIKSMTPAIKACKDKGIRNVFLTMWGDDGAECSKFAVLPSLFAISELAKGNEDFDAIKANFEASFGVSYDSFLLLDQLNQPGGNHREVSENPHKYLLYNDPFCGINDCRASAEDNAFYEKLKEMIAPYTKSGEYAYLFETCYRLADVLSRKCDLGVRTRKAYQENNIEVLNVLAETDYEATVHALRQFHKAFQRQWLRENKPYGFDIQDFRLGGLIQRLMSCQERLRAFCAGDIDTIPELADDILPTSSTCGSWARAASVNVISHSF